MIIFIDIYIPYKLYSKSDKTIISQSDIEQGDSTDSDDSGEKTTLQGGWRFTRSGQGELNRERITMVASA